MFDAKCYDLATAFLADQPELDSEENREGLAQEIQDLIEDRLAVLKEKESGE